MNELVKKEDTQVAVAQPSTPVTDTALALVGVVERAMSNPEVDIDKMERILAMQTQIMDRQAETAYYEAMAHAQGEIEAVATNKVNAHTSKGYADIKAIHEAVKPAYTKYGFSASARPYAASKDNHIGVRLEITHAQGHKEILEAEFPLDVSGSAGKTNKTPLQGMGSTFTYARRYLELMAFNIPIDNDNDGAGENSQPQQRQQKPQPKKSGGKSVVTQKQIGMLRNKLKAAGKTEEQLCKAGNIAKIEDLLMDDVDGAINWINVGA